MTRFLMIAIALAVLGAGVYALLHQQEVAMSAAPASAERPAAEVAIERKNDDELTKKTLEGIGSVTKLKPVELERPREREGAANKQ